MPRPSKVDKLPAELKHLIAQLRERGSTIDEIFAKLKELDPEVDVSRTGVGEHVKKLEVIAGKIRESRSIAEALVTRFGDQPDNHTSRLNLELMHSIVLKVIAGEEEAKFAPAEVMFLAKALQSLSSANKTDVEAAARIRKEMAEKAVKVAEKAINASGAPDKPALVQRVRRDIYGLTK